MNDSQKRLLAALAVVGLLISGAGVGMASVSIDTLTSGGQTATASQVDDGTVINHDANASDRHIMQVNYSSANNDFVDPVLWVRLNESGHTENKTVFAKNTTPTNLTYQPGGTSYDPSVNFNLSITEDEIADVPTDPGENVTVDFVVFPSNASSPSDAHDPNVTAATVTLNESGNRQVIYVGDKTVDADDDVETLTEDALFGFGDTRDITNAEFDSAAIDNESTEVFVVLANGTVEDAFSAANDRKTWFGLNSLDDGDFSPYHQVIVEDAARPVYLEEAPEEVEDDDDATYAITTSVGGHDAYEVVLGDDEFDDADSVDLTTNVNDKYGTLTVWRLKAM